MQNSSSAIKIKKTQPVLIFICCCILAIFSWWYLTEQRQKDSKIDLEKQAEIFSRYITNDIEARLPSLERMVHRWRAQGGTSKEEFVSDARHYIADSPGFQAIEWVDESYHVRWVIPLKGNEKAENLYLGFEERRLKALEKAKSKSILTMTKPINLVQGGKGILVYFPIKMNGKFDGFLLVVFNTQNWIDFVFRHDLLTDNSDNFEVSVYLAGDNIFKTAGYAEKEIPEWTKTHETKIFDHSLTVSVRPTSLFFVQGNNNTARLVLIVFILFGLILASLVYYLKKASVASEIMKKSIEDLDKESQERQRAENKANIANEAKTKFLAAMSHEIRTPLNAVLGVLQLVEKAQLPADVSSKLKIARDSGFFLLTLVNQVLDFARIEAGTVERCDEEFVIGRLIADLHAMFKLQAEKKRLQFDYKIIGPDDALMYGDYSHIKQILFNLIGNAIKFTNQGAVTIIVKVIGKTEKKINLSFEVIDTGPGISAEEQKIIFEEFKQSESGRMSGMGTGLGLSISKQLAEIMGGQLFVTSTVGHGATFALTVEVETASNQLNGQTRDILQTDLPPLRVLVADDNNINQMIIEEMLLADGHTVTLVDDGAQVVNEVQDNADQYDLILMDIQMPLMNGVEATKAIRSFGPDAEKLPIFALTANAFKSQVDHYISVGMQAALTKPIIQDDLRAMIARHFSDQPKFSEGPFQNSLGAKSNVEDVKSSAETEYLDTKTLETLIRVMSKERFQILIDSLNDTFSKDLAELTAKNLEAEAVQEFAHKFRGMAANAGLSLLANKAFEIEELAKNNIDTLDKRLSLNDITQESLKQLNRYHRDQSEDEPQLLTS